MQVGASPQWHKALLLLNMCNQILAQLALALPRQMGNGWHSLKMCSVETSHGI